jgi:hypothetical protein
VEKKRSTTRSLLACGVVGPPLFVAVFLIDGATRPGYDPWRQWISHLSLGDRGWLGTANLLLFGLLMLCFSVGLRRALRSGKGSTWGPGLLAAFGAGFVLISVFPIDPGLGYPPGTAPGKSPSGQVHDVGGAIVFGSLTAVCFVVARRFSGGRRQRGWRLYSLATGVLVVTSFAACSVLASLAFAGIAPGAPSGLFERVSMIVGCAWLVLLTLQLLRERSASGDKPMS